MPAVRQKLHLASCADFRSRLSQTYPNGNKYVGEFKDGQRHGQGSFTLKNGGNYVGPFKDGRPNGQGTQTYPNGNKYVGEFKDGQRHGHGTYTFANGRNYVGEFQDGKPHGQGTETYPNGNKYVGEFKDGQFKDGRILGSAANATAQRQPSTASLPQRKQEPQRFDEDEAYARADALGHKLYPWASQGNQRTKFIIEHMGAEADRRWGNSHSLRVIN